LRLTNKRMSHPGVEDASCEWTLRVTVGAASSLRLGASNGLMSARRTTPLDIIICNDRAFMGFRTADFLV